MTSIIMQRESAFWKIYEKTESMCTLINKECMWNEETPGKKQMIEWILGECYWINEWVGGSMDDG